MLRGIFPISSRKTVPPFRLGQQAALIGVGPGEAAPLVTEKFAFQQVIPGMAAQLMVMNLRSARLLKA